MGLAEGEGCVGDLVGGCCELGWIDHAFLSSESVVKLSAVRFVGDAQFFPGECIAGGGSRDLIDLERETAAGRVYLARSMAEEAIRHVGGLPEAEVESLRGMLATALEELGEQKRDNDELASALYELRRSVRQTLAVGAANKNADRPSRDPDWKLRPVPGRKAAEV